MLYGSHHFVKYYTEIQGGGGNTQNTNQLKLPTTKVKITTHKLTPNEKKLLVLRQICGFLLPPLTKKKKIGKK